jgi:hypothetical protein
MCMRDACGIKPVLQPGANNILLVLVVYLEYMAGTGNIAIICLVE